MLNQRRIFFKNSHFFLDKGENGSYTYIAYVKIVEDEKNSPALLGGISITQALGERGLQKVQDLGKFL